MNKIYFYSIIYSFTLCFILKAEELKATSANTFMEFVGINVHGNEHYAKHHHFVKAKLAELNIRYVRDGIHKDALKFSTNFYNELGIKTIFITGKRVGGHPEWKSPLNTTLIHKELEELKSIPVEVIDAIEGPNEYDLFHDKREKDWAAKLREYQEKLYTAVKKDTQLKHLRIVAPSLTSQGAYEKAGDMDSIIDISCIHLYQSTRNPETGGWGENGYGSIDWSLTELSAKQSPSVKPIYSTENGYKTTKDGKLPEKIAPQYTLRMMAEFFRKGITRSYLYELFGDEWGLIRKDLTEKPSFRAVKNFLDLMNDVPMKTETSSLKVNGADSLRKLLFQKSNGKYLLLLWNPKSLYNSYQNKVEKVKNKKINLSFEDKLFSVKTYNPLQSSHALSTEYNVNDLEVALGGDLLVLEITK